MSRDDPEVLRRLVERAEGLAAAPGVARALERLEALASALSPDELADARRRVLEETPVADVRPVGPARRGRTLAVAFDGVLTEGGADHDPLAVVAAPRPGAIDWVERAVERFDVAIVSPRTTAPGGVDAMRAWLRQSGLPDHALERVRFPRAKPPADVYLSATAWRFEGEFPSLAEIARAAQSSQGSA